MKKIIYVLFAVIAFSCSNSKQNNESDEKLIALQTELDSLKNLEPKTTKGQITTFLIFQKSNAEEAMNFYVGLFENSKVINIQRWDKESPGEEGRIMQATFELNGKLFMCSDSPPNHHDWDFTPAISNYIEFEDKDELERLFSVLSENGKVMMPLDNYGFSQRYGFIEDRFGVSWQLNLN